MFLDLGACFAVDNGEEVGLAYSFFILIQSLVSCFGCAICHMDPGMCDICGVWCTLQVCRMLYAVLFSGKCVLSEESELWIVYSDWCR